MLRSFVRCLGLLLALTGTVRAQQYAFRQYTPKDGLAQSQVRCMAQDARGHLWFGTLGGASRFDGLEFVNMALQEGLPDPHVSAMALGPDSSLWLGSGNALVRLRGDRLTSERLQADARIMGIIPTGDHTLIVGTDGGGLFLRERAAIRPAPGYPGDTAQFIRTLHRLRDGRLLVGLRNGLLLGNGDRYTQVALPYPSATVSALCEGPDGSWWVGTIGEGVYRIHPDGTTETYDEERGLLLNSVRCLLADARGRVWVGTKLGLNLMEPDGRSRVFTVHQGLPNDNINCAFEDREGGIWFGTDGGGALRSAGDRFVTFTVKEGLCSDLVMTVVRDSLDDLWLGTYDSGICRMHGMAMVNTVDGLPNNTVWCGLKDRRGRLWFGTSDGLALLVRGELVSLPPEQRMAGQRVLALFEDDRGTLWCGTREGLSAIAPDGSVRTLPPPPQGPGRSVRHILSDGRKGLWLATEQGLAHYRDGVTKVLTRVQGMSDNTVLSLAKDRRGRLWAGTNNGLTCMDGDHPRVVRFAGDFSANHIGLLVADAQGYLWAGTNNGLFRFHPDSALKHAALHEHLTLDDGLRSLEFNLNAGYCDERGRLFMGTTGGLLMHDPARGPVRGPRKPPSLHITGVRSFLQRTDWKGRCDSLDGDGLPVGLDLPYRRNHITFDYVGIDLSEPEHVVYRYRLVGMDPDWLPATDARFASYSNLPNGEYTFEVISSTDGTNWSAPAEFRFRIDPPFWLRWWFFALTALALGAIAYGIHRYRSLQRERRERTRQLMLRSRMLQLEQQALNANMNRHFVFNALNSIQYHINKQDRATASKHLTSFAKLIRRNLDASQNDTTTLSEELERLELYLQLEHMRFKDRFRYRIEVDPAVNTMQVRLPAMMLQPYVENSIWHGILPTERQGEVFIGVRPSSPGRVMVVIQDDGVGVDHSRRSKGATGDHISRGIEITKGRADVLRRLELTDIRINGPDQRHGPGGEVQGTEVTIELPLNVPPKSSVEGLI
ncbi:MAG TPA: two-component regulator propeller domain-containing protein [Flavobacteriales bacterium]|nr:two-component regulator propeller domain-containing protein [Flavobacteriales bacterium]